MRGPAGLRSIFLSSPRRANGSAIRIGLVHSFYSSRQPSGENNVVEAELRALRSAGHEVRLVAARTDDLEGERTNQVRSALRVASGAGRSPREELEDFGPDVVHVHNLFPNFGRRWVDAFDIPIVHTLHNYRPLCANGQLLRDGRICTLCPDGTRWAGVRHGCYRDSRLATLPISWANRRGPMADRLLSRADRLIVLSELQAELFRSSGTPSERMTIWPNFLPTELDPGPAATNGCS
jgi:glycosyltransferase involved in cell wall biosynthesis